MNGFTKLVPEIVESSIWNEPAEIRCVWIAMLAKKDAEGYVRGDSKTLSRIANVSPEWTEKALKAFQEPDPSSHTPDNEGRRIAPVPGGWLVLNHALYRVRDFRAEHAEYVKNWRKKRERQGCDSQVNHASASVSASASASISSSLKPSDRHPYGELGNVRLTAAEYAKLVAKHGETKAKAAIEILDGYIGQKKRDPYANHYAVMKEGSWVWDRVVPSKGQPQAHAKPPSVWELDRQLKEAQEHWDKLVAYGKHGTPEGTAARAKVQELKQAIREFSA